jgi:hypothetical protein
MQPMKPQSSGAMSVDQLHNNAINFVEALCSVVAMPVETLLRPWYGSRFYAPPIVCFASMMMILLPALSALLTGIMGMIPFTHPAPSIGLFDMASMSKLFFVVAAVHSVRLYRRMIDLSREACSTYEGSPLPFFGLIPWCRRSFWVTRIVAEPVFVLLLTTVLQDLFLIQSGLATYLRLASIALAMKNFVSWYRAWEYLRDILDARNAAPILARLVEDDATDEELSTIHLASFPKDVSEEIRTQAAMSLARAYSPHN